MKLTQPDMFSDPDLIKAKPGTDAGMQLDIFGNQYLVCSKASDNVIEAVEIRQGHQKIKGDNTL